MNWNKLKKKLSGDKGYYLALSVCALAVVISGWLFVRSLRSTDDELVPPDAVQAAVLPTVNSPKGGDRPAVQSPVKPGRTAEPDKPVDASVGAETPTEAAANRTPANEGKLLVSRPVEGTVVQSYSMDRLAYNATTRDWRTHAGMDIAAPEGSEVRAAAEGTVLGVFADELLGQTVTVEHAGGWVTHYANLAEEVAVSAGDRVEAGQVLGTVGHTALAEIGSESHLHFAVYRNNVPQDPEAFLAG